MPSPTQTGDRQTDSHTADRQTDRQRDRQRQTDRETDRHTDTQTDRQTHRQTERQRKGGMQFTIIDQLHSGEVKTLLMADSSCYDGCSQ